MRRIYWGFLLVSFLCLSGCGFMDLMSGVHRDKDGKVIMVDDKAIGEGIAGTLGALVPYGGWLASLVGAGLREYRHYAIIKAGQKDDDGDGKPDAEPPKAAVTIT